MACVVGNLGESLAGSFELETRSGTVDFEFEAATVVGSEDVSRDSPSRSVDKPSCGDESARFNGGEASSTSMSRDSCPAHNERTRVSRLLQLCNK